MAMATLNKKVLGFIFFVMCATVIVYNARKNVSQKIEAYSADAETIPEGIIFKPESEKSEREKRRDKLFLQYATGARAFQHFKILNKTRRLPDVICAGVEKCGSGPLRLMLTLHPMVQSLPKEPHYYDNKTPTRPTGLPFYKSLLPEVYPYEIQFEKTPDYFNHQRETPEEIKRDVPDAKIIMIICDPVNRMFSDYAHEIYQGRLSNTTSYDELAADLLRKFSSSLNPQLSDDDIIENIYITRRHDWTSHFLSTGMYYHHLIRWYKTYNMSQIHIVNGEDLIENPGKVIKELQDFIGLPEFVLPEDLSMGPDGFYCFSELQAAYVNNKLEVGKTAPRCLSGKIKGRTRKGKFGKPSEKATDLFKKFYAPFNEKLYKLLGKRFNWG